MSPLRIGLIVVAVLFVLAVVWFVLTAAGGSHT
jgi:hypothetical protein